MKKEKKLYAVGYEDCISRTGEKIFVVMSNHHELDSAIKAWEVLKQSHKDENVELQVITTTTQTLMSHKGNKSVTEQVEIPDVKGIVTTVIVNDQLYYVYEYDNGAFIDTIIRGPDGRKIDESHPKWRDIGLAYIDTTPDD